MAIACVRTKITLVLVIVSFVVKIHSDSVTNPLNYAIDEIKADHLLRGSGEERNEEGDIPIPKTINVEADKIEENIKEDEKETVSQKSTKDNLDLRTTTEMTTENVPEALGLKNGDVEEEVNDYFDKPEDENATAVTLIEATDATETLFMIDNTIDKSAQDVFSNQNGSNNTPSAAQGDATSSTSATTRAMDVMEPLEPRIVGFDEDIEISGQRNPKTDNSEQKTPIDKRKYEAKPLPQPSLSKSSTLKGWLEDSWLRPPAGILIPLRPMALNRALAVWNDLTVEGLNLTDIVIIGYDSNGVNWRSRHNLQPSSSGSGERTVPEALSKLLLKYQDVNTDATSDGTMRALTSAAKLVPYDSALFVVTDKGAGDAHRLPLALKALVEKRLKVYTVWTDPSHPSNESEEALEDLRNISRHTEGEVLPYSMQVMDMETGSNTASEMQQWEAMEALPQTRQGKVNSVAAVEKLDTLLVRRGGGEAISLGVPVENGVSALRIYIEGLVEHAVLYPPNDAPQIDLYNISSVRAFSSTSRTDKLSPRDIYLGFPGADLNMDMLSVLPMSPMSSDAPEPAPTVGMWHLSVRCDTCDYRLCVTARTQIHLHVAVEPRDMLKIRVEGPVASVRETVLIDEYGTELAKLPFSYEPVVTDGHHIPMQGPPAELIADVRLPGVKKSRVYVKVVGRNIRGEPFVRLSEDLNQQEVRTGRSASIVFPETANDLERAEDINSRIYNERLLYNETNILPYNRAISQVVNQRGSLLTTVQIGLSTRLYGAPGDSLQLHFEVTNYREQSVRFQFEAVGELRFLRGISPTSQVVGSGQTANVIVSVGITSTAQPGARDLITFTAYGLEQVSISAYVYVRNTGDTTTDIWAPELRHNFQGTCLGRQGSDCAQHVWSATVIARDSLGGLLRLSSSPVGLVYDSNFISGSREEVIATYRATCCAPRVMVTAVDAYGNANSYVIDISSYFSEAAIAAIVLGVFLLIAIIALIVFLIYWCVRRRRETRELPTYTTSRRDIS